MARTEEEMKEQNIGKLTHYIELYKKHKIRALTEILESQESRGAILNTSIKIEELFNNILLVAREPSKIGADFRVKAGYIKKLFQDNNFKVDKESRKKFERMIEIRHLYAHIPMKLNEEGILCFSANPPYYKWVKNLKTNEVMKLNEEFMIVSAGVISKVEEFLLFMVSKS